MRCLSILRKRDERWQNVPRNEDGASQMIEVLILLEEIPYTQPMNLQHGKKLEQDLEIRTFSGRIDVGCLSFEDCIR